MCNDVSNNKKKVRTEKKCLRSYNSYVIILCKADYLFSN